MIPALVPFHLRYVIGDQEAAEADFLERADGLDRVAVSITQEALGEVLDSALNVAEVDIEDAVLAAEVPDGIEHSFAGFHFRPAAVAEVESVHG